MEQATGIVLAGGRSTRMGANKALLAVGSRTLVAAAVAALATLCREVIVVANDPATSQGLPARPVADSFPGLGPLAGIHAGLAASSDRVNLVLACDLPFLSADLARHLIRRAPGHDVVVPKLGGYYQPLYAVYSRACLPAVEACLRQGVTKVIAFYPQVRVLAIEADELSRFVDVSRAFFNVNTPADLAAARQLAEGGGQGGA